MGLFDAKLINFSSLDIEFEKVNFTKDKDANNNSKWLVRYEFMELMVRIAGECFKKPKTVDTWFDAVKMLYEKYAITYFKQFGTAQPWREAKLYNEQNDYIFKKHKVIVDNVKINFYF